MQSSLAKTGTSMISGRGEEIGAAIRWYERHRDEILRKYTGEYVAITSGGVVDHDGDFDALAGRIFERLGNVPVYMPFIEEGKRVVHVRSPRVVRK